MLSKSKRSKPIGFVSEHTGEYVLIEKLRESLGQKTYAFIFPHQTREGNTISREIHRDDIFSILGIFPRRPKIKIDEKESIYIKINTEVVNSAVKANEYKIPFICGCPIARNIWTLNEKIVWINMNSIHEETILSIRMDDVTNSIENMSNSFHSVEKLKDFVNTTDNLFDIEKAMFSIRNISDSLGMNRYFFGTIYKPFYVFIKR